MGSEVEAVGQQLAQAVAVMMDPMVAQQQRHQAFQFLEQFKETSPLGSQVGFYLSTIQNTPQVRHFGLKILEDIVKARWNEMSAEEKVYIKDTLLKMVQNGTNPILQEANHIKDQLAKIIVELIKREWPQQWPSLLAELDSLCQSGETQTELVMFILLRLVEDVAVLQTLEQSQRRREIYSALTANMEEIFRFLLGLLENHYKAYLANTGNEQGTKHCKVCMSILNVFTCLVDWVPMQHIMANNKYLLHCLTHLLKDERLQMYAAECLLGVVGWKAGKTTDRQQILSLFDTEFMQPLFAATQAAEQHALEEDHYNFMKKMVQILTGKKVEK